jgi:hypothetical protein
MLRCVIAGALIGGAGVLAFGWQGLWFTLVETPGGLGWALRLNERLRAAAPALALQIALPAVIMLVGRRTFARPTLLLPALAWACTLPLGLAGFLKLGGWTNSIHGCVLWLPAVLATLPWTRLGERRRWVVLLAGALASTALGCSMLLREPTLALRPQIAEYLHAQLFAEQNRGALWFPLHPLITLYSDRRYYHDEDGIYVRMKAGKTLSPEHAASQLPPAMRMMAFRNDWNDWGIARQMLPANSSEEVVGNWTLRRGRAEKSPP